LNDGLRLSRGIVAALCFLLGATTGFAQPEEAPSAATDGYLIGPGDSLSVFVWRQPDLSVTVPVRPDGRVSIPLVEDLVAVGKTPTELAREVETALSEYVRTPQVSVIVQGFVGTLGGQIRVLGEVMQPRSVPFRQGMTLLDAIIEVGGLTDFAAGNRTKLVRTTNGQSEERRVRVANLLKGKIGENIPMRPGDVVIVPESVF
jgi:polysaccharide export outer membrane protein